MELYLNKTVRVCRIKSMLVEQVSAVGQATPVCRIDCAKLQILVATSISPEVVAPTKHGTVLTVLTSAWVSKWPCCERRETDSSSRRCTIGGSWREPMRFSLHNTILLPREAQYMQLQQIRWWGTRFLYRL